MYRASTSLFRAVESGEEDVTTYEAVLNEIFYVMCSPRQYAMTHSEAVGSFRPLFDLEGFRLPRKRLYGAAIELFGSNEALDFADCLLAVFAEEDAFELLTYDEKLARLAGIDVYAG